jgi:hypothetical protein
MIRMSVGADIDVVFDTNDPTYMSLLIYLPPISVGAAGGLCLDPIEIPVGDGPFKDALRKLVENPSQCGYGATWH